MQLQGAFVSRCRQGAGAAILMMGLGVPLNSQAEAPVMQALAMGEVLPVDAGCATEQGAAAAVAVQRVATRRPARNGHRQHARRAPRRPSPIPSAGRAPEAEEQPEEAPAVYRAFLSCLVMQPAEVEILVPPLGVGPRRRT